MESAKKYGLGLVFLFIALIALGVGVHWAKKIPGVGKIVDAGDKLAQDGHL